MRDLRQILFGFIIYSNLWITHSSRKDYILV